MSAATHPGFRANLRARMVRAGRGPLAPAIRRLPYLPPGMLLGALPLVFNPEAGGPAEGILELHISGPGGGVWTLDITRQRAIVHRGPSRIPPTTRIRTNAFTWTAMALQRMDGTEAFMRGRLEIEGDIRLSLKLDACFGGRR